LAEIADNGRWQGVIDGAVIRKKECHGRTAAPALDPIPVDQPPLRHPLAVDERAVSGAAVTDDESYRRRDDLRVVPRDFGPGHLQVVSVATTDRDDRLIEWDNTPAKGVVHRQARASCVRHGFSAALQF
jgi:hypothetical protein